MSATEIVSELPKLTEAERRAVLDKLLELEDLPLSEADEALVESAWRPTAPILNPPCRWRK